jgi:cytochrome c oxidase subunit 2
MNDLLRRLLDLPPQASSYARAIDTLHYFVIGATMLGATFVFLLALAFVLRYRQRAPGATTPRITTSAPAEAFIVGGTLSLFLVFWLVGSVQFDHMMTPPADAMTVHVTAKQWMWKFAYPDGRAAMDELVVPLGRPVKLVMTSRDVIHSFYVPQFRMKHDVVPGRYYVAWFTAELPGTFDIFCAEYCGVDHSRMRGRVRVLAAADYEAWLAQPVDRGADMVTAGRDVAARRGCFNCHTIDGQPFVGPTWAGLYESWVETQDGRRVFADAAYLTQSMMDPGAIVVSGYKPIMPTYRGVLPEPEVAALVEYIVSLRDRPYAPSVPLPKVQP